MATLMVLLEHDRTGLLGLRCAVEVDLSSAIVIFVAEDRGAFAVESPDGLCAVFCQNSGPQVRAGDVLVGAVLSRGARVLKHAEGLCAVVGDSGPVSREQAHELVYGRGG